MTLSPEKLAFIQGGAERPAEATRKERGPGRPPKATTIEMQLPNQLDASKVASTEEPHSQTPSPGAFNDSGETERKRKRRSPSRSEAPAASEVLSLVLVPLTTRLQHKTAQALRRAYLEQRLQHMKPDTQQEIVEEALLDWLERNDYL